MENTNESSVSNALKSGIILGLIDIIIAVLVYLIDPTIFGAMWFGLLIMALNFVLVIVFGIKYRKSIGGFMSFKDGFLHGFVTLVVAGLLGTIFNILLFTVIDPGLVKVITDASIENAEAMMQKFSMPEAQMDEALSEMERTMPEKFGAVGLLTQFGWTLIFYAIVALITGLIVKKKEPIEEL